MCQYANNQTYDRLFINKSTWETAFIISTGENRAIVVLGLCEIFRITDERYQIFKPGDFR